jgi:hypothetical protein
MKDIDSTPQETIVDPEKEMLKQKIREILDFPVYFHKENPVLSEDPRIFLDKKPTEEEKVRFFEKNYHLKRAGKGVFAELILVIIGEQPATDLHITFEDDKSFAQFSKIISEAGILLRVIYVKKFLGKLDVFIIAARDSDNLEKMKKYFDNRNSMSYEESAQMYGELMGFPSTAIDAFVGKAERAINSNDSREKQKKHHDKYQTKGLYGNFAYSKDHADEEYALLVDRNKKLEEYAPQLFD